MTRLVLPIAIAAAIWCSPASAAVYHLQWTGAVGEVQQAGSALDISVGDQIVASFTLDDALATGPTTVPLGGGIYSIYDVPVSDFTLSVGSYTVSYTSYDASLVYMDNSWGADGIVILMDGLAGGPFGSTFADIQFQARGPTDAIDGSGIGNGLPYERLAPSFFAAFSDGTTNEQIYGGLTVSDLAVPEPANWAELLIGFAAVGSWARRSRRAHRAF